MGENQLNRMGVTLDKQTDKMEQVFLNRLIDKETKVSIARSD